MSENKLTLEKTEYLKNLQLACSEFGFKKNIRKFVMERGEELIDLFIQLEKDNMLKRPTVTDFKKINNILRNFREINEFISTLFNLSKGYRGKDRTREDFPIKDDSGNEYSIRISQIVIMIGWIYSSLCEVMKTMLSEVIDFPRCPSGIGDMIRQLKEYNLTYFSDVETDIRNSFFHLDFELYKGKIFYDSKNKSILVQELFNKAKRLDLSIFPLIGLIKMLEKR